MLELNKIYNIDCLVGMRDIPQNSIDCVICDLPFGTTSCKWDAVIPFDELWAQYKRIVKPNGAIVLFGSQPFTTSLIASNMGDFRESLVWLKNKSPSGLQSGKRHQKLHEDIIVFSKSGSYTFNPQKWVVTDKQFLTQRKTYEILEEENNIIGAKVKGRMRHKDDGMRDPISVMAYKVPYTPKKESRVKNGDYRMHPTQKPLELIRYLVRTYSNEGETVLDNCMGSGTTAIACMAEKRNFLGFELDSKYFDIASRRIADYKRQPTLF